MKNDANLPLKRVKQKNLFFVGILKKNTDEKRELSIDTTWINTSKQDLRPREKWQERGVGTNLDF
jgi:hypothetical protein